MEARSRDVANDHQNREFYLSHAWVTDIENGQLKPSIYKLHTLSAIYKVAYSDVLACFGIPIGELGRYRASIGVPRTHLLGSEADLESQELSLPVEFKPEFQLEKTNLLSRIVEKWDRIPVGLLQHLDLRKSVYGYIGLEDYTLYPLIRPGSLVQIDASQRKIGPQKWQTEFDRPIYFVELRVGYACSWCQVERGQLMIIPHPQSHREVRQFDYPSQAEIVGRVTGVAMRIVQGRSMVDGEAVRPVSE